MRLENFHMYPFHFSMKFLVFLSPLPPYVRKMALYYMTCKYLPSCCLFVFWPLGCIFCCFYHTIFLGSRIYCKSLFIFQWLLGFSTNSSYSKNLPRFLLIILYLNPNSFIIYSGISFWLLIFQKIF